MAQEPGVPAIARDLVTVRELVSVRAFGLRVRAAGADLDAHVRWVHPTELIDPRPHLSGAELVLTVGVSLTDEDRCRSLVDHLVAAGVSALGFGVGDVVAELPPALVAACADHGLTLLEVPPRVAFQRITEFVADRRADARAADGRQVRRLVDRLLEEAAAGRTVEELLATVTAELGGRVALVDGRPVWRPVTDADVAPAADVLRQVERVLALRRHEDDLVLASRRVAAGRLLALVMAAKADPEVLEPAFADVGLGQGPLVPAAWPRTVLAAVRQHLPTCVLAVADDAVVTVSDDAQAVRRVAGLLAVPCGIGESVEVGGLRRGAAEATAALALSRRRGVPAATADLTGLEALLELQPPGRLQPYADRLILPLVRHDREHGSALLPTLRAFLDTDGAVGATARRLYLHPNSLRHRLGRIAALTGRSPVAFSDRVALAVGLWAWDRRPRSPRPPQ